jgi:hypothetical protein
MNLGTVKHCRDQRVDGGPGRNLMFVRRWSDDAPRGCAAPGWIRREVDFFVMSGFGVTD